MIDTSSKTQDSKNHESRKVPINNTLLEVINRLMDDQQSDYLFCNHKGEKLTVLTNAFWKAVEKAGLEKIGDKKIRFRFHDLRHTFGSRLGMANQDLKTIMEIMGHKNHKMAMRYQHPTPEHKLMAVKALDGQDSGELIRELQFPSTT